MEYLILQPDSGTFTATLASGTSTVDWHDITSRATRTDGQLTVSDEQPTMFTIPPTISGPAVLHLKCIT